MHDLKSHDHSPHRSDILLELFEVIELGEGICHQDQDIEFLTCLRLSIFGVLMCLKPENRGEARKMSWHSWCKARFD